MARYDAGALAELLAEVIDYAGDAEVVVVPLPTIGRHIRERGFDHICLLAKKLAKRKGWRVEPLLRRATEFVQVGASVEKRQAQAAQAYAVDDAIDSEKFYLLLDDVWTTGSSMRAAYEKIFQAGARKIGIAVIAKSVH